MIADYRSDPFFRWLKGRCYGNQFLGSKLAKSDYSPLFVALVFRNRLQYRNSGFKRFICDDLATLHKNLVNFSPVTAEFNIVSEDPLDRFSPNFHQMVGT